MPSQDPLLLRHHRPFIAFWLARIFTASGFQMLTVAIGWNLYQLTGNVLDLGLVGLVEFAPRVLFMLHTGHVADRYDRRKVLIIVSILQAIAAASFLLIGDSRIWIAFVAQGSIAALAAFVRPALEAAIPNLAKNPDELRQANAIFGSSWGVMLAAGAGIGGLFSQAFGRNAAFIADIATFVIAAFLIALVTRPMQEARTKIQTRRIHPIRDMGEALHLAKSDSAIMALLMSKMTFAVGAGVVSQLAVFAADAFNSGDAGRGLMLGLRGVGSALGPLVAARFVKNDLSRVILVCGVAGLGFAGGYLAAAASPVLIVAAIFIGLAHLGGGAQWTLSTYGLQVRCPDEMRGRVLAGDFALITLSLGLSSLLAGVVSEYIGARGTIAVFAVIAICSSVIYLLATRNVRANLKLNAATS